MANETYDLIDNLLDDFFYSSNKKVPAVDILENKDSYVIKAELPGFNEEAIDIYIEKHVLHIASKEMSEAPTDDDKKYLIRERKSYSFDRSFTLPDEVNEEELAACYERGVLTLTLPKLSKREQKKIEVKIAK